MDKIREFLDSYKIYKDEFLSPIEQNMFHPVINLAEKYLVVKGMPKKKETGATDICWECGNSQYDLYNQCHDDYTLALVKKLDGLEDFFINKVILLSSNKLMVQAIEDYLLGEQ